MKIDVAIERLLAGHSLSPAVYERIFQDMGRGRMPAEAATRFLLILGRQGVGYEELLGGARAFRKLAVHFRLPKECADAMDNCGTGGDGKNTFNISTAASFVIAASGIQVAKHGNRAVSSSCGSADLLSALGVNIEASTEQMLRALREARFGYFHAPLYHRAMRRVAPIRSALKIKTIFNVLGPLLNPLRVRRQLVGVFDKNLLRPVAEVLASLGSARAIIVAGRDGLDEVSVCHDTDVAILDRGHIQMFVFKPGMLGIARAHMKDLEAGSAIERAAELRELFSGGGRSALSNAIVVNAAFGIWAYDRRLTLKDCALKATHALKQGGARHVLDKLIQLTA